MPATAGAVDPPSSLARVAVLIPARRVEPALAPLVSALLHAGFGAILLVDDGSPACDKPAFESIAAGQRVHLLRHAVNLGKGRALKTGINYFLTHLSGYAGLVTADADGQHSAADIVRIAGALLAAPSRPVLGCRSFAGQVPLRSRLGNSLTRLIFHFVCGHRLSDTQSGLRAFPAALLPELLALPGDRYEYEMTVLAHLCRQGHPPAEVPIATIYIDNNRSSHFNPVRDSMRIYFVLVRFYASSLASAAIDFAVFSAMFWMTRNILLSLIVGRVSSLANFIFNRRFVFISGASYTGSLGRYYLLAVAIAAASYVSVRTISVYLHCNVIATKIAVETVLSLVSFSIQRTFVFPAAESR
jgi:glycosyltransferase involved in cell wall biosynthesis